MRYTNRRRPGFTLLELLVVVAILAILVALTTAAVQRVRQTQNVHNTENIVTKLQAGVDNAVKGLAEQTKKDRLSNSLDFQKVMSFCDGDPDRTEALMMYVRLRQSLPYSLAQASPPAYNGLQFVNQQTGGSLVVFQEPAPFVPLNGMGGSGDPDRVSAAFLYVALAQRSQMGNSFASDAATSGAQMQIALNNVSCTVYKDAWANPIGYCLAESPQLPELASPPYAAASGEYDPFDPLFKLANWTNTTNKNLAQQVLGVNFDGKNKRMIVYSWGVNMKSQNYVFWPVAQNLPLWGNNILGNRLISIGGQGAKP